MKRERDGRQAAWQLCTDRLKRLAEEESEAVSSLEKNMRNRYVSFWKNNI